MGFDRACSKDLESSALASRLRSTMLKHRLLHNAPDLSAWSQEFKALLARTPLPRVVSVLEWYSANAKQPYAPQIVGAKMFRQKFEQLEAAMTRGGPAPLEVRPDEYAIRAGNRLVTKYDWPSRVTAETLSRLVHSGGLRVALLSKRLTALQDSKLTTERDDRFIAHLFQGRLYKTFVEDEWLPNLYECVIRSSKWYGHPQTLAFDPASEFFKEYFWMCWAKEWCAVSDAFNGLYDLVIKEDE